MDTDKVLELILKGQNELAAKIDAIDARVIAKIDAHAEQDTREFRTIREEIGKGLGGLRDRVTRMELSTDTIDVLNDSSVDHERRIADVETAQQIAAAKEETVKEGRTQFVGWVQWVVTGLIALCAALGTWVTVLQAGKKS